MSVKDDLAVVFSKVNSKYVDEKALAAAYYSFLKAKNAAFLKYVNFITTTTIEETATELSVPQDAVVTMTTGDVFKATSIRDAVAVNIASDSQNVDINVLDIVGGSHSLRDVLQDLGKTVTASKLYETAFQTMSQSKGDAESLGTMFMQQASLAVDATTGNATAIANIKDFLLSKAQTLGDKIASFAAKVSESVSDLQDNENALTFNADDYTGASPAAAWTSNTVADLQQGAQVVVAVGKAVLAGLKKLWNKISKAVVKFVEDVVISAFAPIDVRHHDLALMPYFDMPYLQYSISLNNFMLASFTKGKDINMESPMAVELIASSLHLMGYSYDEIISRLRSKAGGDGLGGIYIMLSFALIYITIANDPNLNEEAVIIEVHLAPSKDINGVEHFKFSDASSFSSLSYNFISKLEKVFRLDDASMDYVQPAEFASEEDYWKGVTLSKIRLNQYLGLVYLISSGFSEAQLETLLTTGYLPADVEGTDVPYVMSIKDLFYVEGYITNGPDCLVNVVPDAANGGLGLIFTEDERNCSLANPPDPLLNTHFINLVTHNHRGWTRLSSSYPGITAIKSYAELETLINTAVAGSGDLLFVYLGENDGAFEEYGIMQGSLFRLVDDGSDVYLNGDRMEQVAIFSYDNPPPKPAVAPAFWTQTSEETFQLILDSEAFAWNGTWYQKMPDWCSSVVVCEYNSDTDRFTWPNGQVPYVYMPTRPGIKVKLRIKTLYLSLNTYDVFISRPGAPSTEHTSFVNQTVDTKDGALPIHYGDTVIGLNTVSDPGLVYWATTMLDLRSFNGWM